MLLHQNHLLIYEDLAGFGLPNGLCLEEDLPAESSDGIALCSLDKSFSIEVCFIMSGRDARAYLEDVFSEAAYTVTEPIHAVTANNVTGFAVSYETRRELNEEYAFEVASGDEHILLNIWFMRRKNVEQNEELYAAAKAELLGSITLLS